MKEIERKFLLNDLSILDNLDYIEYERFFLFLNEDVEIRIQKKGHKYEFERKVIDSKLQAKKQKFEITKDEFEKLKRNSTRLLRRKSYLYSKNPEISIKVYEEDFEGLNRIEVEFSSVEEAKKFKSPNWFGKEITNSKLGKDKKLIRLDKEEFKQLLIEAKK